MAVLNGKVYYISGSAGGSAVTLDLWAFNIGGFTEASNWDSLI